MNTFGQENHAFYAAVITLTSVYICVSIILYVGVLIFIGKEEQQLTKAFGKEYENYSIKVDRLISFNKPGLSSFYPRLL